MNDKASIINAAQKFAAKGQIDKAILEWEKLLQERKDGNIYNTIGDLHLKKGAETDAVEAFKKAAELFRKDGFYPKAMALYKKVINISPNNVEAFFALARLNADRGLLSSAIETYYRAAEIYNKEGATDKAAMVIEKMLQLSPTDPGIRAKIAYLYFRVGLREKAASEYASIALTYLEKDDMQKAKEFFGKAVEYDPVNVSALTGLSKMALKEGNREQALELLNKALSHDPSNMEAKRLRADIYLEEGLYEKAWEEALPVVDAALDAEKWSDAHALLHKFRDMQTISVKQRLLRICKAQGDDNTIGIALKELASLHENEGADEEALRLYKEAVALTPDESAVSEKVKELELRLGIALPSVDIKTGPEDFIEAREELAPPEIEAAPKETAAQTTAKEELESLFNQLGKTEEKPVDYDSHYISGLELKQKGLLDEAIRELQIAAGDPAKLQRNSTMLALCYMEKGAYPSAIAEFAKIIDTMTPADSTYFHVKYELANAYMSNNDSARALALFSEIQTTSPDFKDVSAKVDSLRGQITPPREDRPKPKKDRVSYI